MLCINTNLDFLLCSNFLFTKMEKGGSGGGLVGDNDICGDGGGDWRGMMVVEDHWLLVTMEESSKRKAK